MAGGPDSALRIARTPTVVQRFGLLALTCFIAASNYFAYELSSITSQELKAELKLDNAGLSAAFSSYALANAVVPLFAGVVFHRFGVWLGLIVVGIVITLGVSVIAVGIQAKSYWTFLAGRLLFGLVGESTLVAVDLLATDWFLFAELGLAMGLIQGAAQAGSFGAFFAVPAIVAASSLVVPYWLSVCLSAVAVLLLLLARHWEKVAVLEATAAIKNEQDEMSKKASPTAESIGGDHQTDEEEHDADDVDHQHEEEDAPTADAEEGDDEDEANAETSKLLSPSSSSPVNRCFHRLLHPLRLCAGFFLNTRPARFLGLDNLLRLKLGFFCVWLSIVAYSSLFYTFLAFGPDFFVSVFRLSIDEAGKVVGLVSIASAILSPLSGLVMDKAGFREVTALLAMAASSAAFVFLGRSGDAVVLLPENAVASRASYLPWVVLAAVCYSVLPSALYPLLPDVIPRSFFTQTYALINASINACLVAFFTLAGAISNVVDTPPSGEGSGSGEATATTAGGSGGSSSSPSPSPFAPSQFALGTPPQQQNNYRKVLFMFVGLAGVGIVATGLLLLEKLKAGWRKKEKRRLRLREQRRRSSTASGRSREEEDDITEEAPNSLRRRGFSPAAGAEEQVLGNSQLVPALSAAAVVSRSTTSPGPSPSPSPRRRPPLAPPASPTAVVLANASGSSIAAGSAAKRLRSTSVGAVAALPEWAIHRVILPPAQIPGFVTRRKGVEKEKGSAPIAIAGGGADNGGRRGPTSPPRADDARVFASSWHGVATTAAAATAPHLPPLPPLPSVAAPSSYTSRIRYHPHHQNHRRREGEDEIREQDAARLYAGAAFGGGSIGAGGGLIITHVAAKAQQREEKRRKAERERALTAGAGGISLDASASSSASASASTSASSFSSSWLGTIVGLGGAKPVAVKGKATAATSTAATGSGATARPAASSSSSSSSVLSPPFNLEQKLLGSPPAITAQSAATAAAPSAVVPPSPSGLRRLLNAGEGYFRLSSGGSADGSSDGSAPSSSAQPRDRA